MFSYPALQLLYISSLLTSTCQCCFCRMAWWCWVPRTGTRRNTSPPCFTSPFKPPGGTAVLLESSMFVSCCIYLVWFVSYWSHLAKSCTEKKFTGRAWRLEVVDCGSARCACPQSSEPRYWTVWCWMVRGTRVWPFTCTRLIGDLTHCVRSSVCCTLWLHARVKTGHPLALRVFFACLSCAVTSELMTWHLYKVWERPTQSQRSWWEQTWLKEQNATTDDLQEDAVKEKCILFKKKKRQSPWVPVTVRTECWCFTLHLVAL